MISTTVPYTTLHSRVYRPFLKAFARATSRIQRVPKVKPFDLCLNSSKLGSTRMGYGIAQIDVILKGGKSGRYWPELAGAGGAGGGVPGVRRRRAAGGAGGGGRGIPARRPSAGVRPGQV
uniref:Xylanase inhibitor C-terminal domain-containing protein n=1 Tax=Ananas comosus var. bracteatus TaxID=296719 RepID=A0A6V7PCR4_ANACO|nr:unnamed protein product [Ananas comosus var. bracteatus]